MECDFIMHQKLLRATFNSTGITFFCFNDVLLNFEQFWGVKSQNNTHIPPLGLVFQFWNTIFYVFFFKQTLIIGLSQCKNVKTK